LPIKALNDDAYAVFGVIAIGGPPAAGAKHPEVLNPHQFVDHSHSVFLRIQSYFFMQLDDQYRYYVPEPDIYHLVASKKWEIAELAARYRALHIRIFGSVARHTADEGSDIDFLVELEPGRTLFDLGGLSYDLEQLLGKPVDVCIIINPRSPRSLSICTLAGCDR
jgi:uncharacterized protein